MQGNIVKIIRSLFAYVVYFISTVVLGTLAFVASSVTRQPKWAHLLGRLWANLNLWVAGVRVRVEGFENLSPGQAYVFLSNHQSGFDILALMANLRVQFAWLAKEELFRIPILGQAMKAAGYIPIDRSDRRKAVESLNRTAEKVQEGTSVMIFPEGTRSPDGVLQDFKKGAFLLAIKSQQLIVPIAISGSHRVLAKGGRWILEPGSIDITIEKPISTVGLTVKDNDTLMRTVRETIRRHLRPEEGGPPPGDYEQREPVS